MSNPSKSVEQVDLRRLVDLAYEEIQFSLLSISARYLLWGSFSTADELAKRYLRAKGKSELADGRRTARSRSSEANAYVENVEMWAGEAMGHVSWARNQGGGQPVLRESLVGYCSALENFLKNVALVFRLAADKKLGMDDRVFVPGDQFTKALKEVKEEWNSSEMRGVLRARAFFESAVLRANPDAQRYDFASQKIDWDICAAAFELRNAAVHQMARPSQQVHVGKSVFPAGWPAELHAVDLHAIRNAFLNIAYPADPEAM